MTGVGGAEEAVLVAHELGDEPGAVLPGLVAEPGTGHGHHHQQQQGHLRHAHEHPEALQQPVDAGGGGEEHEGHLALGEHGQPEEGPGQRHVRHRVLQPGHAGAVAPCPGPLDELVDAQEDEQVEPRIDDAAAEVEVGQHRAQVGQRPKPPEHGAVQSAPDAEEHQQRHHPAEGVGQPGGELVHAEQLHGGHLHPEEERWLFPEGAEVHMHPRVVVQQEHLAGDLREVDLVPIEQVHGAQPRHEEQQRGGHQGEWDGEARVHGFTCVRRSGSAGRSRSRR